jgi:hypothetical protein
MTKTSSVMPCGAWIGQNPQRLRVGEDPEVALEMVLDLDPEEWLELELLELLMSKAAL